ncbi:MAG: peptidoglycan editing factor PgeF [Oscillospiraceae bacterium]|nr:peptidoglycan editing factor PgeF [Oscillospiraceae bacterium]
MEKDWQEHSGPRGERYFTSALLDGVGVRHLFATRIGGVSEGPFGGWNFAAGAADVRDSEANVRENYERAAAIFGLAASDVCRTYQAHTSLVMTVGEEERGVGITKPKFSFGVDGLVTGTPDLLLSVRSADCVPILFADPENALCGAVHAGWKGTAAGIARNAVEELCRNGSRPESIYVAIGPCIGACCYEVGKDVFDAFCQLEKELSACFTPCKEGKYMLDLTEANKRILLRAGVREEQISCARLCTRCDPARFFSHRRMGAIRGTMSAFIRV